MDDYLNDELEAIRAIYPETLEPLADRIYKFHVPDHPEASLVVLFPAKYPDISPNLIQVVLKRYDEKYLEGKVALILQLVYQGEVCMFDLLSEVGQFMEEYRELHPEPEEAPLPPPKPSKPVPKPQPVETKDDIDYTAGWTKLDPILDRGSTFIAYSRKVSLVEEAREHIDTLTMDRRIARASHNITSWRIRASNGVQFQDCDDDGETAAGGRLLHLLTMMDAWNVVVCVLRWFGGTHLGPDRFKHINTAARNAVLRLEEGVN